MITIRHRKSDDVVLLRVDADTLDGIDLSRAYLRGADLRGQNLRATRFADAVLNGADLTGTWLHGADLCRAKLVGADFTDAALDGVQMTGAKFDCRTVWPCGFDPVAHGAECEEQPIAGSKGGWIEMPSPARYHVVRRIHQQRVTSSPTASCTPAKRR